MTIFINQYFFMEVTKSLTRESEEDDEQTLAEFSSQANLMSVCMGES